MNNSFSASSGTIRGMHMQNQPNQEAKLVRCVRGEIWDVIVDVRPSSPTYQKWVGVEISAESGKSIFINGQLGHAFIALEDETVVTYLVDSEYSPNFEMEINPLDSEIGITWPDLEIKMSRKDSLAPQISTREKEGNLPNGL
jgi:dTDP-4-dehydrorhamnose 3,5-epimerase